MIQFARTLPRIAALACLAGVAACQSTVTGQSVAAGSRTDSGGRDPAQLEFRKVLVTEPVQSAPGTAPQATPDRAEIDRARTARQNLDPADQSAVRAALDAMDCAAPDPLKGHADPALPLITCDRTTPGKYLLDRAFLTGADVAEARAELDQTGSGWTVQITFSSTGAKEWADFTTENVDGQVAVVLDAEVVSAPTIQEPILGGSTVISGRFTREEAEQLAEQLGSR